MYNPIRKIPQRFLVIFFFPILFFLFLLEEKNWEGFKKSWVEVWNND